eukprot:gene7671-15365_t
MSMSTSTNRFAIGRTGKAGIAPGTAIMNGNPQEDGEEEGGGRLRGRGGGEDAGAEVDEQEPDELTTADCEELENAAALATASGATSLVSRLLKWKTRAGKSTSTIADVNVVIAAAAATAAAEDYAVYTSPSKVTAEVAAAEEVARRAADFFAAADTDGIASASAGATDYEGDYDVAGTGSAGYIEVETINTTVGGRDGDGDWGGKSNPIDGMLDGKTMDLVTATPDTTSPATIAATTAAADLIEVVKMIDEAKAQRDARRIV